MSLAVRTLFVAVVLAVVTAAPAQARPVSAGSHTQEPFTICGDLKVDCTATGQALPVSGRLTTVRIGHDQLPSGGATSIKLKLFRQESNGNLVLVRDIGTAKPVQSDTTLTEWTGLTENVSAGQILGFFVDNRAGYQLLMFSSTGGSGLTLWTGDVTTSTADEPNYETTFTAPSGLNLSAVVRAAPITTIDSGPSGTTDNGSPFFTYSADESATFECSLDGAAYAACSASGYQAPALNDGAHTFSVRATNDIGQVGPAATRSFTIDRTPPAPPPPPPAWGIPFTGQSWTFTDPADSRGGAATDIESVRMVYDAAGKFGAIVRFHGAGAHRFWLDLHRSEMCSDYAKELWVSHMADDNTIWATAPMNGVQFVTTRTSGDGREVLITIDDPRIAGLALRCLSMRSMAGDEDVDTLSMSLTKSAPVPFIPPREQVIVILRQSLAPVVRVLQRRTPQQLARKRTHTLSVAAPGPGSVGLEWAVTAKVAKRYGVRVKRGVKKVTLAVGAKRTTKAAKKVPVKVKVSSAGRKVLRKAKRLKMQVRTGYLAEGGDTLLAATRSVQLGGKKKR